MPKTKSTTSKSFREELIEYFKSITEYYDSGLLSEPSKWLNPDIVELLREVKVITVRQLAESDPDELLEQLQTQRHQGDFLLTSEIIRLYVQQAKRMNPEAIWSEIGHDVMNFGEHQKSEISDRSSKVVLTPVVHNEDYMTIEYLEGEVIPFTRALCDFQEIFEEVIGGTPRILIYGITRNSPITLSIEGVADAVRLLQELVTPWRRKHAENMAKIAEKEAELQTEKTRAEVLMERARARREIAEARKKEEEIERLRLDNEKEKVALEAEKMELAINLLAKIGDDLQPEVKQAYAARLLPPLNTILSSDLELRRN